MGGGYLGYILTAAIGAIVLLFLINLVTGKK
ncbi:MAG: GlsB/YeaQ/YmgE family stress response membrane protein [Chitinophagales bacterium]|nr:GlsB/YeaQ/YmgE family stress response membrane protein [Chitinophagales bacterium]